MSTATTHSLLNPSTSTLERRIKFMESLTRHPADINKLVNAAHEKLSPIIKSIIRNPKKDSNFITKEQFEDAVIASKIIGDINSILKLDTIEKLVNNLNFDLEKVNIVVSHNGLIFVDTALLLHLIDLHTLLEEFIEYVDPNDDSDAADCLVQTDSCITCDTSNSPKLNKFTIKMTRPQNLADDNQNWPALTDFIVLPSIEDHERENEMDCFIPHIKKRRSEGFLTEEETTDITNVVGARDIIEKCICDLERVQCFLEADFKKPVADSGTDMRREPSDRSPSERRHSREKSQRELDPTDDGRDPDSNECCCKDSCGKFDLDKDSMGVCGDDNVVICIKGRNPDEGDVQIVIRQCPDCRSVCAPCPSTSQTDRGVSPDREISAILSEKEEKIAEKPIEEPKKLLPEIIEKPQQPHEDSYEEPEQEEITQQLQEEGDLEEEELRLSDKRPPDDVVSAGSAKGSMKRPSMTSEQRLSHKSADHISQPEEHEYEPPPPQQRSRLSSDGYEPPPPQQRSRLSSDGYEPPPPQQRSRLSSDEYEPPPPQQRSRLSSGGYEPPPPQQRSRLSFDGSSGKSADLKSQREAEEPPPQQSDTDILKKLSDLNVILPPVPHQTPKDEPKETQTPTEPEPKPEKSPQHQQFRAEVGCSKMQLFESKKLCLSTEQGEELLITLTVTPNNQRELNDRQLILKDLFSEEDSSIPKNTVHSDLHSKDQGHQATMTREEHVHTEEQSINGDHRPPEAEEIYEEQDEEPEDEPENQDLDEDPETHQINYFQKDRVIPLERTKVCSSMEFDVKLVDTKFRKKGINPNNRSILVQLKEIGVDNLLRACRPAKCCRKAVLNEKMKKYLPYPPSLKSLPLDEEDLNVINQSLQMSLQKVKNSTDLRAKYEEKHAYCLNNFKVMYSLMNEENNVTHSNILSGNKKLNYYINLVNDNGEQGPLLQYDVMYFEVKNTLNNLPKVNDSERVSKISTNRRLKGNDSGLVSDPITQIRKRFNYRDERPLLGGTNISKTVITQSKPNVPKIFTELNQIRIAGKPGIKKDSTKIMRSKIPVLQPNLLKLKKVEEQNENSYDVDIFSLDSDKYNPDADIQSYKSQLSTDEFINVLLSRSNSFLKKRNSRNIIPRGKRKKPEFCCARSKSEISLNNIIQHHSTKKTTPKETSCVKINAATSAIQNLPEKNDKDIETLTKLVVHHLSELLYKVIRREIIHDTKILGAASIKSFVISSGSTHKSQGVWGNREKIHKEIDCSLSKDLDSIKSDKLFDDVENSLPIQASISCQLKLINQECQTLNIWSFSKPVSKKVNEQYKKEDFPNSCDEMDNFIVVFKSEHSVKAQISDVILTNSATDEVVSDPSSTLELSTEESISKSLLKLKETLKGCDQRFTRKRNVVMDPVEYMVYNNYVKPSSFIQKLINKTKTILKNSEDAYANIGNKYCRICKCEKSKCIHEGNEKPSSCACPENIKKTKQKHIKLKKPKSKSQPGKSWCDLSKIKSLTSFKDLKSKIKKSMTNILKRSKGQYVNMSASLKPCRNEGTMACSPQCVKRRENRKKDARYCETLLLGADGINQETYRKNLKPKDIETSTRRLEMTNDDTSGAVAINNQEVVKFQDTNNKKLEINNHNESDHVLEAIPSFAAKPEPTIINSVEIIPRYEDEHKQLPESRSFLGSSLKQDNIHEVISKERSSKNVINKDPPTVDLNGFKVDPSNVDSNSFQVSQDIEINFDECCCKNCDRNDESCCCETCPGCSVIEEGNSFVANHAAIDSGPQIIIASANPNEVKYFNIGSNFQPVYSVLLPHNLFDINGNFGCNNPFQNTRYNSPQEHRFWNLEKDNIFDDIFKRSQ